MAVARSFRDGWLTSLKVDSLRDDGAELFLFRLGLKADKNGVHFGDPELLRTTVYPLQGPRRRLADVTRYRDKCVAAGLLRLWTAADGRPYACAGGRWPGLPPGGRCLGYSLSLCAGSSGRRDMSDEDSFMIEKWEDATREVLFDACCLSQQVMRKELGNLAGMHQAMGKIHAEAARRGMKFPDLLTDADKAALAFLAPSSQQN